MVIWGGFVTYLMTNPPQIPPQRRESVELLI